ncbi:MAG: 3-dehydroquinate synthase II [Candidatus Micrarchaeia archaeon]
MKEVWVEDKRLAETYGVKLREKASGETVAVASFQDLKKVEELDKKGAERVFISCPNWKVIPLENLVALAKKIKIIAEAKDAEEAKVAFQTLEKGVDGVFLSKPKESELKEILKFLASGERLEIVPAIIKEVRKVGMGGRACIDTAELMTKDEGMLVGSAASGLLLMQAEVSENPHVASRPFRVNCGAVSLYTLMADGRTKYLSEVKAGDEVLIVARDGSTRKAAVVRNKIEWRPMLLIEAEAAGKPVKAIVQDAETIRVLTPKGSESVAALKKGDAVLVRVEEEAARHFGMKVKERIIEQ